MRDWFPQRHICWPTAQLEAARRLYSMLHEEKPFHDGSFTVFAKEPSRLTPFHVGDGTTIYLAPVDENPGEDFLTDRFAKPAISASVAQQSDGDHDEPDAGADNHGQSGH